MVLIILGQIKRLTDEKKRRDAFQSSKRIPKIKQGVAGFLNGCSVSALADTGSRKNVISQSYCKSSKLKIKRCFGEFQLGNSHMARSIGTVSLEWAFAKDPKEIVPIVCHVLPNCIYDLILGKVFLTATQTLSRCRDRLTQCSFSTSNNIAQFCFLGETDQRLQGTLGDAHNVCAVPDTGAERNVIDRDYALEKGLEIKGNDEKQYLGFADGTCQETEGRVDTHWTFSRNGRASRYSLDILKRRANSDHL
ncbi:hypothetical protein Q9189_002085 [Teloschistes chrysophthalmus]